MNPLDAFIAVAVAHNSRESRPGNRAAVNRQGGKSGLHRAGCQVTPGGREPTESATEKIPPLRIGNSVDG